MNFKDLNINEEIKSAIKDLGFEKMMPIQEKTIPLILKGENIIGEADTGTGKTAAFIVPILNNINLDLKQTECLIVTPTRELAMQIIGEIKKIGKYLNISYATLVGGMSIRDQGRDLKNNPAIVVGTLGRINDHLRNKKLNLSNVKYFILDEADEMLKEGFKEDITIINKRIPKDKQTLLFSATISKQILALSKTIMNNYKFISVKDKENSPTNIEQYYIIMKENQKFSTLINILDIEKPASALIFGRTKKRVDELNEALNKCGYKSVGIHGDLSQQQRNAVMRKFKNKEISILVATDVAARGLDINDISHVYNFDLPQEVEFYIHRIGRTGRAFKKGISYSFIKEIELSHIKKIEKEANFKINAKDMPTNEELINAKKEYIENIIIDKLSKIDITKTKDICNDLLAKYNSEKLISILIDILSGKNTIKEITLTGEPPVVTKKQNKNNKFNNNYKRNINNYKKQNRNKNNTQMRYNSRRGNK
ncbi:MAG: DEAD/DEAH box helicase [Bacilli bacterium]|nr:DEAD/DEAH box helicase [Bacilli bacterium]MDD4406812.1 DEAD/DEAH box helicase [Bacilli bacterium]